MPKAELNEDDAWHTPIETYRLVQSVIQWSPDIQRWLLMSSALEHSHFSTRYMTSRMFIAKRTALISF